MSEHDDLKPPKNPNFLKKQLERTRFERALEIIENMVDRHAFLNSAELGRINNVLRGELTEPWREGAAVCALPTGKQHSFQLMSDPVSKCREILTKAKDRAASGEVIDGATDLYADLVLTHVFKDANRRTAAIAAAYLLKNYGFEVSPMGLHDLGLGDLRAEGQREALRDLLKSIVKVTPIRSK